MSGQVDLDALEALHAAAAPGPWRSDNELEASISSDGSGSVFGEVRKAEVERAA